MGHGSVKSPQFGKFGQKIGNFFPKLSLGTLPKGAPTSCRVLGGRHAAASPRKQLLPSLLLARGFQRLGPLFEQPELEDVKEIHASFRARLSAEVLKRVQCAAHCVVLLVWCSCCFQKVFFSHQKLT